MHQVSDPELNPEDLCFPPGLCLEKAWNWDELEVKIAAQQQW